MAYETYIGRTNARPGIQKTAGVTSAILLVAVILISLANVPSVTPDQPDTATTNNEDWHGEDWHGNVRRSHWFN